MKEFNEFIARWERMARGLKYYESRPHPLCIKYGSQVCRVPSGTCPVARVTGAPKCERIHIGHVRRAFIEDNETAYRKYARVVVLQLKEIRGKCHDV